jgi:hypothetical protein
MRRLSRIERRSLLSGWIKWALLPMIPFCVFFFDAWLNVQIRNKDYELSQLNEVRRKLDAALDDVHAQEARLSGVEHLTEMAAQLELSPPGPQQFKNVTYCEAPRRIPVMNLAAATDTASHPVIINLVASNLAGLTRQETPVAVAAAVTTAMPQAQVLLGADNVPVPSGVPVQTAAMPQEDMEFGLEDLLGKL